MSNEPKKDEGQVKIRLPANLKQELQRRADRNRRTVTMEIVSRLERSVEAEQTQGAAQ